MDSEAISQKAELFLENYIIRREKVFEQPSIQSSPKRPKSMTEVSEK